MLEDWGVWGGGTHCHSTQGVKVRAGGGEYGEGGTGEGGSLLAAFDKRLNLGMREVDLLSKVQLPSSYRSDGTLDNDPGVLLCHFTEEVLQRMNDLINYEAV